MTPQLRASFADRLACPDCGALAERIGVYEDVDGPDGTERRFKPEPVLKTTKPNGFPYELGDRGVEEVRVGRKPVVEYGVKRMEDVTRVGMLLTHWCTNPDCAVVFPENIGHRFMGPLPETAYWQFFGDEDGDGS